MLVANLGSSLALEWCNHTESQGSQAEKKEVLCVHGKALKERRLGYGVH